MTLEKYFPKRDFVVSAVVRLDAGPLVLLSNPHHSPPTVSCRNWIIQLKAAGRRVIVPEITDYEIRRELSRANKPVSIALLDALAQQLVPHGPE